jgi:serine/threonine protein kinase
MSPLLGSYCAFQTLLFLLDADNYGVVRGSKDYEAQISILVKEAQQLQAKRHPHIVGFIGMVPELPPPRATAYVQCPWLMMEMADLGSLDNWILMLRRDRAASAGAGDDARQRSQGDLLKLSHVLQLFLDVLCGLDHLHNMAPAMMHRDLKPANILVFPRESVPEAAADVYRCVVCCVRLLSPSIPSPSLSPSLPLPLSLFLFVSPAHLLLTRTCY